MADPWWSQQAMAWIGAGGGILGALAGVHGALAGTLAPRGIGKVPVLAVHGLFLAVGIGSLGLGLVALVTGQPYRVWYPLLLIGLITTLVLGMLLPVVLMRYRQAEQRRLQAEQLRRG